MRIAHRLLLGLLVVVGLAGGLAGTAYFIFDRNHERQKLEFVGGMVANSVFERLDAGMREHRGAAGLDALIERQTEAPVRRIFLVNDAGKVRATSDQSLRGRALSRADPGCRGCHRASAARSIALEGTLRLARPLLAEASCRDCHPGARAYLGCLVVDLDLASYIAEMREEIGVGLLLALLFFLLVGGAAMALTRSWITLRLEAIDAVLQRFEGGDLDARAAVTGRDEISRVENGFNRMAGVIGTRDRERSELLEQVRVAHEGLLSGEEQIRRAYDIQRVLNELLRFSLGERPLDAILQRSLDLLLGIPWLAVEAKGSIFIAEGGTLVMRAHSGLDPELLAACSRVPFGRCLCGRAAAERRVVHATDADEGHSTRFPGMLPHGHYCVPILSGAEVVGVINLYLSPGHAAAPAEITFLNAVANTLAGVLVRRSSEERLRASEQRFRTLAEAASDTIFILDGEQRLVFVNGAGARLFHGAADLLVGVRLEELFPTDTFERLSHGIRSVLATGEALYSEDLFPLPAGEIWLGTTLVALPEASDQRTGIFGISRDITAQRQSQAERERLIDELRELLDVLTQSQREWQNTFDGITDMLSILDSGSRIVKVNRAYADYFGAHPRDLIGRRCTEFCIGGHERQAACPLLESAAAGVSITQELLDPRTGRIFRISIFPYASTGGAVDRFFHLAEDVSVEREREQRLMMSERLAALGQMASGIAHEINNPLASIAGCAEALLGRLERDRIDPALFREYLGIVHEEVFRCKKITTAMLSFVRRGSRERAPVRLDETLDRALELIGFQGRLRSVSVVRDYQPDLPAVLASEDELRQVMLVVLSNALDAMQDRGELRCVARAAGGTVSVSIADTGPGIPPESLGRLFTPFHTTKADRGGTGLGLSIAKGIIEDHRGRISLVSPPGGGAIVTIALASC